MHPSERRPTQAQAWLTFVNDLLPAVSCDEIIGEAIPLRVLLIEDDKYTSRSIELILEEASINVFSTDQGEEGLDLAKLYDYDIVLLDLSLPDMSGHDVLKALRLAKVNTPVLVL